MRGWKRFRKCVAQRGAGAAEGWGGDSIELTECADGFIIRKYGPELER